MKILVAGATGSIGLQVMKTAIEMGHQPRALIRNQRKVKLLPQGTDIFYGDVSQPETLTDVAENIDAVIFTLGSDGQGRIGARAIDYGGVRNIPRTNRPCVGCRLTSDAAINKTFELVAELREEQNNLTPLFSVLLADDPRKNEGILDLHNMPLEEEPGYIIDELNLFLKSAVSVDSMK